MPARASMDFFHYQDAARKRTSMLVACYILAVILIILAVYLAFIGVFIGLKLKTGGDLDIRSLWQPLVFVWVAGITVAIVLVGSLYKIIELGKGGEAVAAMLGGRPIDPETADLHERKILNVVEEMAIASGTPVPRVFLLEEDGINAFAAGFLSTDAVVAVTRGCVARLGRDELQGVVAHEFSHILNGDMRLNIRLIGILNGILIIAMIGYWLLRSLGRSRSSSRGKGGGAMAAVGLFALLLMAIGYIGVFFGKLIKSAVSRQREFLADASAVQFTRNPAGIVNALKKIGGFVAGSRISHSHAEEASHFFFADGLAASWFSLMATHPPLDERIRRLDPQFDGDFDSPAARTQAEPEMAAARFASGDGPAIALNAGEVIASVGAPTAAHLAYAASLMASLPAPCHELVREPAGARAVIFALLLGPDETIRRGQLDGLNQSAGRDVLERMAIAVPLLAAIKPEARLPAAELAVATLKHLSAEGYARFVENMNQLIAADKQMDLFEYTLRRMVLRRLAPLFEKVKPPVEYHDMAPLRSAAVKLLSCLAYWGAEGLAAAQKAFSAGMGELGGSVPQMFPMDRYGVQALDEALAQLNGASPALKRTILAACTACIGSDGKVTIEEAELLRAVGDALGCPIPPFLPGEKIADAKNY